MVQKFILAITLLSGIWAQADINMSLPDDPTFMDEFDPNSPDAEAILKAYDAYYEQVTGQKAWVNDEFINLIQQAGPGCYRYSCKVFIYVKKSEQKAYLHINGKMVRSFLVSSGTGNRTPNFDQHPNGRIYNKYTSTKFPGGDYAGLGNMPYAVFIRGGFALHGTPKGNWGKLGRKASHGCIRMHPDNGKYFNQLVRSNGIRQTWITVE